VCLALIAFVVLLAMGASMQELQWPHVVGCMLFAAAVFAVVALLQWSFAIFYSVLAVIDIVLVLIIFKGDIRIR